MVFGQPQFLPLLSLALLPLLIHLLARRQRRIVKFSMTRFLQEVAQQTQGRRWLRELLLLLLRTGTVLFALLTLVRPYAFAPLPLPPAPTSIAIVLDNSLSMLSRENGAVWFERGLGWCEKAVRDLPAEIALIAADKALEPICDFTRDLKVRLQAVRRVRPTFKALDLTPSLQTADTLLSRRPAAVKGIIVVTDMQSEPFRSLKLPRLGNSVTVVDVKGAKRVGNVRLNAKLRLPLDPGADGSIVAELQNLGGQTLKGEVTASVSDKPFARAETSLRPQAQIALTLPLPSWVLDAHDEKGFVQVEIRWRSGLDIFPWDDFVRFKFKSPKKAQVANLVKEGRRFVDAALRAVGIAPVVSSPASDTDFVIASAPEDFETAKALANWLRQGGVAAVFADNIASPFWSEVGVSVQPTRKGEKLRVQWVDETDPILRGLGAALQAVVAQPILELKGERSGSNALASLTDGTPLLVKLTVGSGQCFIFTVPLNAQRTTLVHSPAFVPLIYRLVRFAVHGHELVTVEAESEPQASPRRSTVVPKSEGDFGSLSRSEVSVKLRELGVKVAASDQPPSTLLSQMDLKDLTSLCLFLALLCLLAETVLTLRWWRRAR